MMRRMCLSVCQSECSSFQDCAGSFLMSVSGGVRSCMVEESGTLESQLEATKVNITASNFVLTTLLLLEVSSSYRTQL